MTIATGSPGPRATPSGELAGAARGGLGTLAATAASAGLGFALVVVLGRALGVAGSGIVLQAVAVFTVALGFTRMGLDTTAVWLLPRLVDEDPRRVPEALTALLVPALVAPLLAVASWLLLLAVRDEPVLGPAVDDAVTATAWFLPSAVVMTVALAATRAFGGVLPFNLVSGVGAPAARVAGVAATTALGGAAGSVSAAWGASWLLGMVAALAVLPARVARTLPAGTPRLAVPRRELVRRVARFSLPRTVSAGLEQANTWIAVVLVGVTAGAASAGAYGTAARFVATGVVVATAVRVVVAPRFSALLGRGEVAAVQELYVVTARWVLLLGAPVYLVLAVNAPTVLGWLGEGFEEAGPATVVLCLGSVVLLAAGNVQSLLLMSGRSGAAVLNKCAALVLLVGGTVVLVPRVGIEGAAAAWVAGTVVDTALAAWQVRRAVGVAVEPLGVLALLVVIAVATAGPCLLTVALLGPGVPALLAGSASSLVLLLAVCRAGRRPLHLDELLSLSPRRSPRRQP